MFVWVMRDKGSEWRAVSTFVRQGALPFVPLVEAVCEPYLPRDGEIPADPVSVMQELGARLMHVATFGRAWVDLGHLIRTHSEADVAELHSIVRTATKASQRAIVPVIRATSPDPVVEAVTRWAFEAQCGLCIRMDGTTHLKQKAAHMQDIATSSGLPMSAIDFVVDAQDLPRAVSHEALRDALPLVDTCREWIHVAGSFPSSITSLTVADYEHRIERAEWSAWREEVLLDVSGRRPQFGDFATQPAIYAPSSSFPGSPSVRYTCEDEYIVLRGRGGSASRSADYKQYIGHARFLQTRPYFRRTVETLGDDYVDRIATGLHRTGNLTTWRVASLQRHIQLVAVQTEAVSLALSR